MCANVVLYTVPAWQRSSSLLYNLWQKGKFVNVVLGIGYLVYNPKYL
jgi:hypothetical protein